MLTESKDSPPVCYPLDGASGNQSHCGLENPLIPSDAPLAVQGTFTTRLPSTVIVIRVFNVGSESLPSAEVMTQVQEVIRQVRPDLALVPIGDGYLALLEGTAERPIDAFVSAIRERLIERIPSYLTCCFGISQVVGRSDDVVHAIERAELGVLRSLVYAHYPVFID